VNLEIQYDRMIEQSFVNIDLSLSKENNDDFLKNGIKVYLSNNQNISSINN